MHLRADATRAARGGSGALPTMGGPAPPGNPTGFTLEWQQRRPHLSRHVGGAIYFYGGVGTLTVDGNSTISGNSAVQGEAWVATLCIMCMSRPLRWQAGNIQLI